MYYPEEIIEEVRQKNDIVDIISGYVSLKRKGSYLFGLCPFHNEKTGSFSVSPNKQMFYCYGCGEGGNVYTFLMKYENASYTEAIERLAERAGVVLPKAELTTQQKKAASERARLYEVNKEAATYYYHQLRNKNGQRGMAYFEGRKLLPETMQKFGLGYSLPYSDTLVQYLRSKGFSDEIIIKAGLASHDEKRGTHDKFWNRVMFPIQDFNHKVIGFGGRVMGEGEPKYLNSPETPIFDKSRNLYGLNFARTSKKDYLIICEGYMDVISMHQAGFIEAVASLGTAFTLGQASILKRFCSSVILSYDSDGAGTKAAIRAIGILNEAGLTAKVLDLKPYKDPDEFIKNLGTEALQERIDNARNSILFEIEVLERDYNLKDPEEKTAFHREIAKRICQLTQEIERNNYTDAICGKYNISVEAMKTLIRSYAGLGVTKPATVIKSGKKRLSLDEGQKKAQRLLITWISEEPSILDKISGFIDVDDFTNELYHSVAQKLFESIKAGNCQPASIISLFEDEEEQKDVALLFNTKLCGLDGSPIDMQSGQEREKTLKDILVNVKTSTVDYYSGLLASDVSAITKMVEAKKKLEELKKSVIHI